MIVLAIIVVVGLFMFFKDDIGLAPNRNPSNPNPVVLPDLTANISMIKVTNNSVNGSVQFSINYTVTYSNIGNATSFNVSSLDGMSIKCIGGGGGGGGPVFTLQALNPNQAVTYQHSSTVNCYGRWGAVADVDYKNILPESNENNNYINISLSI